MKRTTIIEIITVLFVILFLYTGICKLIDYQVFKEQVADSPVLAPVAVPVAAFLPWTEFFVVLLLIIPRWRLRGLQATLALMVIFTGYVLAILIFTEHLPCSCGGIIAQLSWRQHLFANAGLIILAVIGVRTQRLALRDDKLKWELLYKSLI